MAYVLDKGGNRLRMIAVVRATEASIDSSQNLVRSMQMVVPVHPLAEGVEVDVRRSKVDPDGCVRSRMVRGSVPVKRKSLARG